MYVARDKDGKLGLFSLKPNRCKCIGWNNDCWDAPDEEENGVVPDFMEINSSLFPELTWEDEPIEVEIVSKAFMDDWRKKHAISEKWLEFFDDSERQEVSKKVDAAVERLYDLEEGG